MNLTFPLSLSRMTRAFVKEVYLINAFASTSSETSLLKSPTNRRNQAMSGGQQMSNVGTQRTPYPDSTPRASGLRIRSRPPSSGQSCVYHPWQASRPLHHVCQSWLQAHKHSAEQGSRRHIRKHLLGREQCGQRKTRQRGTSDLDKVDGTGSHHEIAVAAAAVDVVAVAVAAGIAGSRGYSS